MTVTIPMVVASRPEGLIAAAAEVGRAATMVDSQIARQQAILAQLGQGWQGTAADAAQAKAAATMQHLQWLRQSLTGLQLALQADGAALVGHRNAIVGAVGQLTAQGWLVAPYGSVSVRPGSALDFYARLSPGNALLVQRMALQNTIAMVRLLAAFTAADMQAGQNISNAVAALAGVVAQSWSGSGPATKTPTDTGPEIPKGKSTEEVKRWWDSLSKADKERLIREHPDELGGLRGVPISDEDGLGRSKANEIVMNRDLDRVANAAEQHQVSVQEVVNDPAKYGLTGTDIIRYNNAAEVKHGLEKQASETGAETYLYVYEPEAFNGQGRAAIAIGNPDTAADTVVMVPGTGHSVTGGTELGDGWLSSPDPTNVFHEADAADPTNSTAVVAWMGYDAPDSLVDPRVATTNLAREGGELLAADVNALNVTHSGDSHITAIGHSYGSTTVADAAAGYGMRVDDVVLVGSPGTDLAKSAADFHLPEGGNLFVGSASTDPVTLMGKIPQTDVPGTGLTVSLGNDPAADGYGSTRFKAEVHGINPKFWEDHSEYFTPGSESLYSIGDIVSGQGEKLQEHGMTAKHRGAGILPEAVDPELFRPATTGHYHEPH